MAAVVAVDGLQFIKIGQQFSTRVDVLSPEFVKELEKLQVSKGGGRGVGCRLPGGWGRGCVGLCSCWQLLAGRGWGSRQSYAAVGDPGGGGWRVTPNISSAQGVGGTQAQLSAYGITSMLAWAL